MSSVYPSLFTDLVVLETETEQCAGSIRSDASNLQTLIADLGPLLTNTEASSRQIGLDFLSKVVSKLPCEFLSGDECHFLASFYVDRVKDNSLMYSSVVLGFHTLALKQKLDEEDLLRVLRVLTEELQTQSLVVSCRTSIFEIFAWAISSKLDVLRRPEVSSQFVLGFLQAVEGETNPRNLHVIFSCWPVVIKNLDSDVFLEDIFEVLSCYFPIDFTPPKVSGGGYRVTKEDLSHGLHVCLAASPKFAPFAIPLFMEKLSSDLTESKIDAIICFRLCLQEYSPTQLADHLKDVWNNCKQEIMGIRSSGSKAAVVGLALDLLEALSRRLCQEVQTAQNLEVLERWIDLVWTELKPFLKFVESNLMETAVKILCRLSAGDQLVSGPVINRSFPILMDVQTASEDKVRVMELMCQLLEACHPFKSTPDWAPRLLTLCEMGCFSSEKAWREVSHRALQLAAVKLSYSLVDDVLLECFRRASENTTLLNGLALKDLALAVVSVNPDAVTARCEAMSVTAENAKDLLPVVSALSVRQTEILNFKLPQLVQNLTSKDQIFLGAIMISIRDIFTSAIGKCTELLVLELDVIQKLMKATVEGENVDLRNSLLSTLTAALEEDKYLELLDSIGLTFLATSSDDLVANCLPAVLCAISPSLLTKMKLSELLFSSDSQSENLMRVRGSIFNKISPATPSMAKYLSDLLQSDEFVPGLEYIAKGLVMRGSKEAGSLIRKMMAQFKRNRGDEKEVKRFLFLLQDSNEFGAANHHRILSFYKQKIFHLTFPTFNQWFRDGEEGVVDILLLELPYLPLSVVEAEVSPVLPQLAHALFNSSTSRLSPAMSSFLTFVRDVNPLLLEEMSVVMIPFLLRVAVGSETKMGDKITALNVLESLASEKCPQDLKKKVIGAIAALLNDNKRMVRRAAVDARNAWMIL